MLNNKDYFKEYYKQNKEKIIFRVKTNYHKNKKEKIYKDNKQNKDIQEKKIIDKPIIVTFN